jgi:prevent-host-death family protein
MRAEDVIPLTEYRAHLTSNFQHVQETGRPLFVTSNGRTAAVVLSPGAYDELASKAELTDHLLLIDRGLEDVGAGRVHDAHDGIRELAKKYGIPLGR